MEDTHHLLLDAARLLSASLDLSATLDQVTGFVVPRLADYCQVHLRGFDGDELRQVAASHADRSLDDRVKRLTELGGPGGIAVTDLVRDAIRTGSPLLVPEVAAEAVGAEPPAELAARSYAVLPLVARGSALGALLLVSSVSGRRYDTADHALAELLEMFAARVALALDNVRLYEEVRRAHRQELRTAQLEGQLVQARLEALRAQLNPHFLFNALNTIAMLVRRQANAEALRGIVGLSQLLRQVLDRRGAPEVSLGEELALVEHYLAIEQLRYPDRLGVRMTVADEVLDAQVPSLLLQPLVENAVRHGIGRRSERGWIRIAGLRADRWLTLEVRDDGPGFPDGWNPATSAGIGLANTRERLQRLYGRRHRLDLRNGEDGGAVVAVTLPFHTAPEG
jgi:LytS/YehU family sensor histidine kinase